MVGWPGRKDKAFEQQAKAMEMSGDQSIRASEAMNTYQQANSDLVLSLMMKENLERYLDPKVVNGKITNPLWRECFAYVEQWADRHLRCGLFTDEQLRNLLNDMDLDFSEAHNAAGRFDTFAHNMLNHWQHAWSNEITGSSQRGFWLKSLTRQEKIIGMVKHKPGKDGF